MRHPLRFRLPSGRASFVAIAAFAFALLQLNFASASTLRVLHAFCAATYCADGQTPKYPPISGSNGVLYGNTAFGGEYANGVVYALTPNGAGYNYKVLYSFVATPGSPLTIDKNGNLYGTTVVGGAYNKGTFFEIKPNAPRTKWTEVVHYSFCPGGGSSCADGQYPTGPLTYPGANTGAPYDGVSPIYGVTPYGGNGNSGNGSGVAFRITPVAGKARWRQKVLYNFCSQTSCADGAAPDGGVVIDASGNLLGTTSNGGIGPGGFGTIFKIVPDRLKEIVLYAFCPTYPSGCAVDGINPDAPITLDTHGHLFGTAANGGAAGHGAVFKLTLRNRHEVLLHSFCVTMNCLDGKDPNGGLTLAPNGDLFGVTSYGGAYYNTNCDGTGIGCGTVFRLHGRKLDRLTTLHSFCKAGQPDCWDGDGPAYGTLLRDGSGNLFGVAQAGGKNGGGTVFEWSP